MRDNRQIDIVARDRRVYQETFKIGGRTEWEAGGEVAGAQASWRKDLVIVAKL
jgi:hypothetical protein